MYKDLRKQFKLTQKQIAKIVGLAEPNYNKVENGSFVLTSERHNHLMKFYKAYSKIYEKSEKILKKFEF